MTAVSGFDSAAHLRGGVRFRWVNCPLRLQAVIMDDREASIRFLRFALESAGYQDMRAFTDPATAVSACIKRRPELVLLGLSGNHFDGLRVIKRLREEVSGEFYFPILVLAADLSSDARLQSMLVGAKTSSGCR